MHPYLQLLLRAINFEEREQSERYRLDQQHALKALKAEGIALHPIIVTRKSFGYADYPEISFRLGFPPEMNLFRDGAPIECFIDGQEPVKGILLSLDGKNGEFRLFAPDFPDWIEDSGVGIKLAPDTRTTGIMKKVLGELNNNKPVYSLFEKLHGTDTDKKEVVNIPGAPLTVTGLFINQDLNTSQRIAVTAAGEDTQIVILHGPPGTGKTTTLVEAISQLVRRGEKLAVAAPSNTAVDHIAKELIKAGINILRIGNMSKVDPVVFPHTPEGKLAGSRQLKEIKQLKIRAEEFRRMALKYKRSFGKAEREQRNLLFKEVRNIREEIKKLQAYNEEKLFEEASVIAGTPIGLYDSRINKIQFNTVVLDEAGQCIEPLAWCIFSLAPKIILAGDHLQLPPTVLSEEAAKLGLNRSILEVAVSKLPAVYLLNTQYRMRSSIAAFSSTYFYEGLLITPENLKDSGTHVSFIDTAGSGFTEERGPDGFSLQNEGELKVIHALLAEYSIDISKAAVISPYSGQVTQARDLLPQGLRISTIDSFQGQEKETIIVSLVRSNEHGEIGFLKDYRRMNVAITRAKENLFVIGDSATIGNDPFYKRFLSYVELRGSYRSVWEFEL